MLILIVGALVALVVLRLAWWVVARLLPALARLVMRMTQGIAAATILGGGAALIAAVLGGDPFAIGVLTTVFATPFCVAARLHDGAPRPVRTSPRPVETKIEPESADARMWCRARVVAGRPDARLALAEAQIRRFREYAALHPLNPELIDYAPLIERRVIEAVDLAEEAVALARDRAEQEDARRHLVDALAAIGAGAEDRLTPARLAASERLATLVAYVTARARR